MPIQPEKWYSLLEAQKLVGIKSRQYLTKYISEGKLVAIQTGTGGPRVRYAIKGEWLADFKPRYDKGLVAGKRYSNEEARELLEKAISKLK